MKGALAGIVIIWIMLGVVLGAVWAFDTYPETSLMALAGLAITILGAVFGWSSID